MHPVEVFVRQWMKSKAVCLNFGSFVKDNFLNNVVTQWFGTVVFLTSCVLFVDFVSSDSLFCSQMNAGILHFD